MRRMPNIKPTAEDAALLVELRESGESEPNAIAALCDAALTPATIKTYMVQVARYERETDALGVDPYAGETAVAAFYAGGAAGCSKTLHAYLTAISWAYVDRGLPDPTRSVLVRRAYLAACRAAPLARPLPRPISPAEYRAICAEIGDDLRGLRDRAVLALLSEAALTYRNVIEIQVGDITFEERGAVVHVRRQDRKLAIARRGERDGVSALKGWVSRCGIDEGPLLRSIQQNGRVDKPLSAAGVVSIVQHNVKAALGIDVHNVSPGSLRVGHIIEALRADTPRLGLAVFLGFHSTGALDSYLVRAGIPTHREMVARPAR